MFKSTYFVLGIGVPLRRKNFNKYKRLINVKDDEYEDSSNVIARGSIERAQWGLRGGCYPWVPVAFTRRERPSEGAKVADLMQLNWLFRTE